MFVLTFKSKEVIWQNLHDGLPVYHFVGRQVTLGKLKT